MTDQDALMAAICSNRSDPTPRLVYADWLEDHDRRDSGEACANLYAIRAELIRLQISIAELRVASDNEWCAYGLCSPYCSVCPQLSRAVDREKQILDEHEHMWYPISARASAKVYNMGFLEQIDMTLANFIHLTFEEDNLYGYRDLERIEIIDRIPSDSGVWTCRPVEDFWGPDEFDAEEGMWLPSFDIENSDAYQVQNALPPSIFEWLPLVLPSSTGSIASREFFYRSREDARSALSNACLANLRADIKDTILRNRKSTPPDDLRSFDK